MKRFNDPDGARRLHETKYTFVLAWSNPVIVSSDEEERYWYLKCLGYALESAGTDTVGAPLVLLNLLEGYANLVRKLCLRETLFQPPRPNASANFFINRICASRPR